MACTEFEDLILEYCEGSALAADRVLLDRHIAACPGCRAFLDLQRELDLRLAKSLPRPALSPDFAPRLATRIAREQHAARFRRLPRILDWTGYLALAAAAGCLIQQLPHAATWIALTGLAAFSLWQTGRALRDNFGHR